MTPLGQGLARFLAMKIFLKPSENEALHTS
jgi:hypothetical protein